MTRIERIDAMLDKHEITELLYAYCNAADRHDHVKMRSLYHEDAYDDHGSLLNRGLVIAARICKQNPNNGHYHIFGGPSVKL